MVRGEKGAYWSADILSASLRSKLLYTGMKYLTDCSR
jgi:hypothetical protein